MLASITVQLRNQLLDALGAHPRQEQIVIDRLDAMMMVALLEHALEQQAMLDHVISITKMTPGEPERFL